MQIRAAQEIVKNANFSKSACFHPVSPISNPPQISFVPPAAQAALERFTREPNVSK